MQASGAGDEVGEDALVGSGLTRGADATSGGASEGGLAIDDAVEGDGEEHPAGEDEAAAGGVEAEGEELDVGLLGVALEGGLEDAGPDVGVEAAGERGGGHRAEAGRTVPSRIATPSGAPARGGTRPSKVRRSSAVTEATRAPRPTTAFVQVRRVGRDG